MATHGKARRDTELALINRRPFDRSGRNGFNMCAVKGSAYGTGQMPSEYANQYRALADAGLIAYTVISYRTPIAWVTNSGTVVIPDVKYSVTTSHHQSLCRVYL